MILLGEQGNCPCVHAIGYQCSQNDWRQYVPLDSHQQIEKNRRHSRKTFDLKGIFRSKQSGSFLGNLTSQWNKKQAPDSLCCISIGKRILIRSYWTNVFSHVLLYFPMLSSCNETKAKSITVVFLPFCCCCFRVFCYEQVDSFKSEAYERKTKRAF